MKKAWLALEDGLVFEGEGFGGVATLASITRFTSIDESVVQRTLNRLTARGDVVLDMASGGEYRLTDTGRREAARRFAAECHARHHDHKQ